MTGKPIQPSGTAQDRIGGGAVATGLPPETASELERMRGEAARIKTEGGGSVNANDLVPFVEGETTDAIPTDTVPEALFGVTTSFVFQIADGRIIEMGPPPIPHMLIIPKLIAGRTDLTSGYQLEADTRLAKVLCYVRRVNEQRLQIFNNWSEVTKLARELGELGCRACYEAYNENWPDYTATGWTEVKKSVSSKNSATSSP